MIWLKISIYSKNIFKDFQFVNFINLFPMLTWGDNLKNTNIIYLRLQQFFVVKHYWRMVKYISRIPPGIMTAH